MLVCRLGKQLHRLPNIGRNIITDVGLDEASPTYQLQGAQWVCRLGKQPHRLPNIGVKIITDVGQMKLAQPTGYGLSSFSADVQ